MPHTLRIIVQLALSAPLLVFYPAALMALASLLTALGTGDLPAVQKSLFFAGTGVALTGLIVSILVSTTWLRKQRWPRYLVIAALELGWVLAVVFMVRNPAALPDHLPDALVAFWTLAGPAITATWNLVHLYVGTTSDHA